jgi:hypothetical protein
MTDVQVHESKLPLRYLSETPLKGVSATALVGVTRKRPRSNLHAAEAGARQSVRAMIFPCSWSKTAKSITVPANDITPVILWTLD